MAVYIVLTLTFFVLAVTVLLFVNAKAQERQRQHAINVIDARAGAYEIGENGGRVANKAARALNQRVISAKLKKAAREQKAALDTKSLTSIIMQAGFNFPPLYFWLGSVAFGAAMYFIVLRHTPLAPLAQILLGLFFTFGFPRWLLKFIGRRRQKAFLTDFADALDGMLRLLKSGMPVAESIAMVSREFEGPLGEEMGRVYHAQKLGTPMADAIRKMVPRMPLAEVQMFATAIAIQTQTGSSLAEVLMNLSGIIRARARLKRKIIALSSEAKISAMIIAALPIMVASALAAVSPEYIGLLFHTSTGKMLAYGAVSWMGIGVLAMRQMINFKI